MVEVVGLPWVADQVSSAYTTWIGTPRSQKSAPLVACCALVPVVLLGVWLVLWALRLDGASDLSASEAMGPLWAAAACVLLVSILMCICQRKKKGLLANVNSVLCARGLVACWRCCFTVAHYGGRHHTFHTTP